MRLKPIILCTPVKSEESLHLTFNFIRRPIRNLPFCQKNPSNVIKYTYTIYCESSGIKT